MTSSRVIEHPCAVHRLESRGKHHFYEKSEYQISHPLWRDERHIIVWGPHAGSIHYHHYEDSDSGQVDVVGEGVLTENGHMTYSPVDPRWLLSDTYPDTQTNERLPVAPLI